MHFLLPIVLLLSVTPKSDPCSIASHAASACRHHVCHTQRAADLPCSHLSIPPVLSLQNSSKDMDVICRAVFHLPSEFTFTACEAQHSMHTPQYTISAVAAEVYGMKDTALPAALPGACLRLRRVRRRPQPSLWHGLHQKPLASNYWLPIATPLPPHGPCCSSKSSGSCNGIVRA